MKDFIYFFRLSRPLNVLITFLAYILGAFIAVGKEWTFFAELPFWYGAIALTVITATGYWVNDAFDFKIDRVNRPRKVIVNAHLSVKKVLTGYFIANGLVLAASFWLQDLALFIVNAYAVLLLYAYAAYLKRTTMIGNIAIASLTALAVYYAGVIFGIETALVWTVIFAFEVTFLREVVKDMEDIEGDLKFKLNTLPIRAGVLVTKQVLYVAFTFFILSCYGPLVLEYMQTQQINWTYLVVSIALVQFPAVFIMVRLKQAEEAKSYGQISNFLKVLIFLGMISVLFIK